MYHQERFPDLLSVLRRNPHAWANLCGSPDYPGIHGRVCFYQTMYGVLISVRVTGLPDTQECGCHPVYGFHIHEGCHCSGNTEDPFADVRMHFNPYHCPHPYHAGDLPPLFGSHGCAFSVFLTDRFTVSDIIGRTVIIHSHPDDFTTQPSGNSGIKIACGEIKRRLPH